MITELSWYLEEGRFSKLYTEFEEALTEYADARKTGDGSESGHESSI